MRYRTYIVILPTNAGANPAIDICLEGPVGSLALPVKAAPGGTAPPAGWNGGDGSFAEIRSRTLRVPQHKLLPDGSVNPAWVPVLNLGWLLSQNNISAGFGPIPLMPSYQFSASLVSPIIAGFPDPSYGAVLRLFNDPSIQGRVIGVNLGVAEERDDDRANTGN